MVMGMQTRRSAAQWGEMISGWEASGLSADVFAKQHGVPGSTLRWWKTELARRARHEDPRRPPKSPAPAVALARVVRPGEVSALPAPSTGVTVLAGGARVVVERGFDRVLLREVLRALEDAR